MLFDEHRSRTSIARADLRGVGMSRGNFIDCDFSAGAKYLEGADMAVGPYFTPACCVRAMSSLGIA